MYQIWRISTGPSALSVSVTNNNESLSSAVQWDAVDDSLDTNYTVTWTSETDHTQSVATTEQTSYTITGLTLDTVYTITVAAINICGGGPEFNTSVSFSTGTYIRRPVSNTYASKYNRLAYYVCIRISGEI